MRVGVLGGSFDPVHVGHLMIAEEARGRLSLDKVLFVPAGLQWMKEGRQAASAADRLEMVRRALAGNPAFEASDIEVTRPGPSYTVDTLEVLRRQWGPDTEIFFILGWDALAEVHRWHRPQDLLRLCHLVGMPRIDGPLDLEALEAELPGLRGRLILLDTAPRFEISSTDLRGRLARGEGARYLVPEAALEYIRARGLYRATAPPGS